MMARSKLPLGLARSLRRLVLAAPIALVACAPAAPPPPPQPPPPTLAQMPALPTCEASIQSMNWRRGDDDANRMVGFDGALPWRRCANSGGECAVDILDSFALRDEINVGHMVPVGESLVLGVVMLGYDQGQHKPYWLGERVVFDLERHTRSQSPTQALARYQPDLRVDRRGGVHALLASRRYGYLPPQSDAWTEQVVVPEGDGGPITQLVLDSRDRPVVVFNDVAYRPREANDPGAGWASAPTYLPSDAQIIAFDGRGRGFALHLQPSQTGGKGYIALFRGRGDGSWQEDAADGFALPEHIASDAPTGQLVFTYNDEFWAETFQGTFARRRLPRLYQRRCDGDFCTTTTERSAITVVAQTADTIWIGANTDVQTTIGLSREDGQRREAPLTRSTGCEYGDILVMRRGSNTARRVLRAPVEHGARFVFATGDPSRVVIADNLMTLLLRVRPDDANADSVALESLGDAQFGPVANCKSCR